MVYEKDYFPRPRYGLNPSLEHEPYLDGPRGKPLGAYAVVRLKGSNTRFFRFMTVSEIEERRRRSATPDAGPWVTDWEAMALKTVARDAIRWLPLSIEVQRALAQDETVKTEIQPDMTEAPLRSITAHATMPWRSSRRWPMRRQQTARTTTRGTCPM